MTKIINYTNYLPEGNKAEGAINVDFFNSEDRQIGAGIAITHIQKGGADCVIIYDRQAVRLAIALLEARAGEPTKETLPEGLQKISSKLKFESFASHAMGRGYVAYSLSESEKSQGNYDPHIAFLHEQGESADPDTISQVVKDCAMLSHLLNKFRIANDFIRDEVIARAIVPTPPTIPEGESPEE